MKRKECMIKTTNDWAPNYPNSEVKLFLSKLNTGDYRVAVFGMDDCGMNKDIMDIVEACSLYNKIKNRGTVSFNYLTRLGFEQF